MSWTKLVIGWDGTFMLLGVSTCSKCAWCDKGRSLLSAPAAISEAESGTVSPIIIALPYAVYARWTLLSL